jgi:hypothetical protein
VDISLDELNSARYASRVSLNTTDMKKTLVIVCALTLALLVAGAVWLQAAPTVGTANVSPAYVVMKVPTPVLVTIGIADPSVIAAGVNLLKVDSTGKSPAIVGVLRDDGTNGDVLAGDKVFSGRFSVNEPAVGQVRYQVSAAFKGALKRVLSNVVAVTIDPFALPPDPGAAGKVTLVGIDLDNDGVRDDVQRYIALTYPADEQKRVALSQYSRALQLSAAAANPEEAAKAQISGVRCIAYTFGDDGNHQWVQASSTIRSRMLDTQPRLDAYAASRSAAPLNPLPDTTVADSELVIYCAR